MPPMLATLVALVAAQQRHRLAAPIRAQKTGKNISQITLNGDGCSGFASRTETVFWMESDAGVVFDRKDSRWLSWDTNSW